MTTLANTPAALHADRIEWICDVCHRPASGIDGYIHVSHAAVANHQDATRQQEARDVIDGPRPIAVILDRLLSGPFVAAWRVHHVDCDPTPDSNDYWIGLDKLTTFRNLSWWTAHLMEKTWLQSTNWDDILRQAAGR